MLHTFEYRAINYENCRKRSPLWNMEWVGVENNSRRINKDILLCDRYLNCMISCWKHYLDYKYATARKAGNYLLTRKSTWRGWDNWWFQDIDFGWFDTLQCRVSCVSSFRGTSFCLALFVRMGYFTVEKYNNVYLIFSWLSHGGSTRDPPLLVSQANPVHEFTY